jgi:hypothetical protein
MAKAERTLHDAIRDLRTILENQAYFIRRLPEQESEQAAHALDNLNYRLRKFMAEKDSPLRKA